MFSVNSGTDDQLGRHRRRLDDSSSINQCAIRNRFYDPSPECTDYTMHVHQRRLHRKLEPIGTNYCEAKHTNQKWITTEEYRYAVRKAA